MYDFAAYYTYVYLRSVYTVLELRLAGVYRIDVCGGSEHISMYVPVYRQPRVCLVRTVVVVEIHDSCLYYVLGFPLLRD